jgi:hypothetical protein
LSHGQTLVRVNLEFSRGFLWAQPLWSPFIINCLNVSETSESYEFLQKRTSARQVLRGGRDYYGNTIDEPDQFKIGGASALQGIPGLEYSRERREHISFLAGVRIIRDGWHPDKYSGYQVMRLATELVPAFAAILG